MNEYLNAYRKYATFTGRSRRRDYWMFVLINTLISLTLQLAATLLGNNLFSSSSTDIRSLSPLTIIVTSIYALYVLGTLVPNLAINVRRLHDAGYSGWFYLIWLIPLVGPVVLIIFTATDSVSGSNRGSGAFSVIRSGRPCQQRILKNGPRPGTGIRHLRTEA